jgi:hypothetical protein
LFNPGHVYIALANFALDPVPCDPDGTLSDGEPPTFDLTTGKVETKGDFLNAPTFDGYWQREALLTHNPLWAGMEYASWIEELENPNQLSVEVHTTSYGDEDGELELDVIHVDFESSHWKNFWHDGVEGVMDDETGNFHYDITGLLHGWQPKWNAVPKNRRLWE